MTGYIYKITSPSKRIYIGQTINFERRKNEYLSGTNYSEQPKLNNSFIKYGAHRHKIELITECDVSELNKWERYYQDLYSACGKNGLNCILTGYEDRCGGHSEESKIKMSVSRRANPRKWSDEERAKHIAISTGRKHKPETIAKIKFKAKNRSAEQKSNYKAAYAARKGVPTGRKGIPMSEEQKQKLRTPKSEETKKKLSEARMGKATGANCHVSKIVLDLSTGIFYECAREAAECSSRNYSTLKNKLNGTRRNDTSFIYA